MSDKVARARVERRDRLVFRDHAEQAGVPLKEMKRLYAKWKKTNKVRRVTVDDFWFEMVLDDEWAVAYRIVAQPVGLAVGEVRVFPVEQAWREGKTPPGEWSGVLRGTKALVPRGGVTSRLLRQVRIDRNIWYCLKILKAVTKRRGTVDRPGQPGHGRAFVAYALERSGVRTQRMEPTPIEARGRSRGRPRVPAKEYARLARAYQRLVLSGARGKQLHEALASKLGLTLSQVRNRIARGREYGFFGEVPLRGWSRS